jgi:hypothetical protein
MNWDWAREPGFLIGTAIGVLGLIFAVYQTHIARQRKEPTWAIDNTYLIRGFQSQISGLKVLFGNEPVEHLSLSRIAFWNNGGQPIRAEDITDSSPLRITAKKGADILDVNLLAANRKSNEFSIFSDDPEIEYVPITFVHLDKGNGGVIQIVHTGQSADSIKVEGDIIGVANLNKRDIRAYSWRKRKWDVISALVLILGLITLVVVIVFPDFGPLDSSSEDRAPLWMVALLFITYAYALYMILWPMYRDRLPRGLEAFHDDPFEAKSIGQPEPRSGLRRFMPRREQSL